MIAANLSYGIEVAGVSGTPSASDVIAGNTIGGTSAASGNTSNGILAQYTSGLSITSDTIENNKSTGIDIQNASSSSGTIAGDTITSNTGDGIDLESSSTVGFSVLGNTIGANTLSGVLIGSSNNTIGGTASGNVIAANLSDGIEVQGTVGTPLSGDVIAGNTIGGTSAASGNTSNGILAQYTSGLSITSDTIENNKSTGIDIQNASSSSGSIVGDTISSNTGDGIDLESSSTVGFSVLGNTIGANTAAGVLIGSSNNTIGGTASGNVIAANLSYGIEVAGVSGTPSSGDAIAGNTIGGTSAASGNSSNGILAQYTSGLSITSDTIENNKSTGIDIQNASSSSGSIVGDTISSNTGDGIDLESSSTVGFSVLGNTIGANTLSGVLIGSSNNTIGGTSSGNVIAANLSYGIEVAGVSGTPSSGDVIAGNTIGGTSAASGNTSNGILAQYTSGLSITADTIENNKSTGIDIQNASSSSGSIAGDTISTNTGDGIDLESSSTVGFSVLGNTIGANTLSGVFIGSSNNTIGGTASGNVIASNLSDGIEVQGTVGIPLSGDVIAGNTIGGTSAASGNSSNGILAQYTSGLSITADTIENNKSTGIDIQNASSSSGSIVGDTISTNTGDGIDLESSSTVGFSVLGNTIGANTAAGVLIGSSNNTIGGTSSGNVIASNLSYGIEVAGVSGTPSSGDVIAGNTIGGTSAASGNTSNGILAQYTSGLSITSDTIENNKSTGIDIQNASSSSGSIVGDTISTNTGDGIDLESSSTVGFSVLGNTIGANTAAGVLIGSSNNTIGGTSSGNVIASNLSDGIEVQGTVGTPLSGDVIAGNTIGGTSAASGNTSNGILAQYTSGLSITADTIENNKSTGIDIQNASSSSGTIAGDTISTNTGDGIDLESSSTVGFSVLGNTIGANTLSGVLIGSSNNTIGGTASGNVIAANLSYGIEVAGVSGTPSSGDVIAGNTIGGTSAASGNSSNGILAQYTSGLSITADTIENNKSTGIDIQNASSSSGSIVGDTISSNTGDGIDLESSSTVGFSVLGNTIGANTLSGVLIGSSNNTIGGTASGNVIASNLSDGIEVQGTVGIPLSGDVIAGNTIGGTSAAGGNTLNGILAQYTSGLSITADTIENNKSTGIDIEDATSPAGSIVGDTITSNTGDGIDLESSSTVGFSVLGNTIGANTSAGVLIGSSNNTIGGTASGNVIASNLSYGIEVAGVSGTPSSGDVIAGNTIGGTSAASGNSSNGILAQYTSGLSITSDTIENNKSTGIDIQNASSSSGSIVGDTISSNTGDGIDLESSSTAGFSVLGNTIGANTLSGVLIGSSNNTIGGTSSGNVIAANLSYGIEVAGVSGTPSSGDVIAGNTIGGTSAASGNTSNGILAQYTSGLSITSDTIENNKSTGIDIQNASSSSGTIAGDAISSNTGDGIDLESSSTVGFSVLGNTIGANTLSGVLIGSSNNTIGGTSSGNVIAANLSYGIEVAGVSGTPSSGDVIAGNTIGGTSAASGNSSNGILAQYTSGLSITSDTIEKNKSTGIDIQNASSSSGTIAGDTISSNTGDGIDLESSSTAGFSVLGNTIGANTLSGVLIGSSNNTIGGTASGNVIAANLSYGIEVAGVSGTPSSGDVIAGNTIGGTSAAGGNTLNGILAQYTSGLSITSDTIENNKSTGIDIQNASSSSGTIAGDTISSNTGDGIDLESSSTVGFSVLGNTIGANTLSGVLIGSSNNTIGGTSSGNVIASNLSDGIEVQGTVGIPLSGDVIAGNTIGGTSAASGNTSNGILAQYTSGLSITSDTIENNKSTGIDIQNASSSSGSIVGDTISSNTGDGIDLESSSTVGFSVLGNTIGANTLSGVLIGSSNNTIGGTSSGNVIASNLSYGIEVQGTVGIPLSGDVIAGNTIGGTSAGSGNTSNGILAQYTSGLSITTNTIENNKSTGIDIQNASSSSGTLTGDTISSNTGDGIDLESSSTVGFSVLGNTIGANTLSGVLIGSSNNTIGGTASGNVIAANLSYGIEVAGVSGTPSSGDVIAGNTIGGTSAAGGNTLNGILAQYTSGLSITADTIENNKSTGIDIQYATSPSGSIVGDTISTNTGDGIDLESSSTVGFSVLGNTIGANTAAGVLIGSSNNTIGGTALGSANVIESNMGAGVALANTDPPISDLISGNSIYGNGALGIDLDFGGTYSGQPLPNDSGIANNNGQNYPVLTSVAVISTGATATGTFDSTANLTFTLEFLSNITADPSGYGQGQTYLTSTTVTTDGSGHATFSVSLGNSVTIGMFISSTATDPSHDTSEFSADIPALPTTTTTVTSSQDPSVYGQSVTFTATVVAVSPGSGTPTGEVDFSAGTTPLGMGSYHGGGVWTITTSALPVETDGVITAMYDGDVNFSGSSGTVLQDVDQSETTTTVTSSQDPSVYGQSVTFTATVEAVSPGSGTPTGEVDFSAGTTPLGMGSYHGGGVWTITTSALPVETDGVITAMYDGDVNFSGSSGTVLQDVDQSETTTTVTSSQDPSVYGQSVTFTATVEAVSPGSGTPTGEVDFSAGTTPLGMGSYHGGGVWTITTSALPVETDGVITAMYDGDVNFSGSSGTVLQDVDQSETTTTVTSSQDPSVYGQSVTFTATVEAVSPGSGTPTGEVDFSAGTTPLGMGSYHGGGVWTITTSALPVETDGVITAMYDGDVNFSGSSGTVLQDVDQSATTTTVTSSQDPSVYGQSVTFTATVEAVSPGSGTPTGEVDFSAGTTPLGMGSYHGGGVWTITTSALPVETDGVITAMYDGDVNFSGSSGTVLQDVDQSATTTTVTSSQDPSVYGQSVTFTATVEAVSPGSGTPTGEVDFSAGTTPLGMGSYHGGGVWTITTSALPVETDGVITAMYDGDVNFSGSSGTVLQDVDQSETTTTVTSSDNPSVYGQSVTFTATVVAVSPGSGTPTGEVDFSDGTTPLGMGSYQGHGVWTITTSALPVETDGVITAMYDGDVNFSGSSGTVLQDVDQSATTTTVTSSQDPSVYGQSVTFTATVEAVSPGSGTPTGEVDFSAGTTPLGMGSYHGGGVWTITTSALPVETDGVITAMYDGDVNFSGSSGTVLQDVDQSETTTTVTSSDNPSVYGQSVTFTATVVAVSPGSGTPTGEVDFSDGTTPLGMGSYQGHGVWTIMTSALPVETDGVITAMYDGDVNFSGSSGTVLQDVDQSATTTTVTSSDNPSVYGQSVTFTATVEAVSPGSGTPTGEVDFSAGTTPLGMGSYQGHGVWTITTSALPVETDGVITAMYDGDVNFSGSSGTVLQDVDQSATTTTVTSSDNPSVYGQTVTFTAMVEAVSPGSGTPTGEVDFSAGTTPLGMGSYQGHGVWTITTSALPVETDGVITAMYDGDVNFSGSSGTVLQDVDQSETTTTVTSSDNPSVYGQSVTFTATVEAVSPGSGTPTGEVDFSDGTTPLGMGSYQGHGVWTITTSTLSVETHPAITATYDGDGNFLGSSGSVSQEVDQSSTETTVISSVNPSALGESVTFTATVTPSGPGSGTPTGVVDFSDGTVPLGTGTSRGDGVWTITTSTLSIGTHPDITATYLGDSNFSGSSGSVSQTVDQFVTQTTVTSSVNPSVFGQPVTFTATVLVVGSGPGTPTGTVTFFDGQTELGTGTSQGSGVWTFSTGALSVGTHADITADYDGSPDFPNSDSPPFSQVVNKASTRSTLTATPNPGVVNQPVTFKDTVVPIAPGAGTPTGTVTFRNGTTVLGTATLNSDGVATITGSFDSAGQDDITATYSGDPSFLTSVSQTVAIQIDNPVDPAVVTGPSVAVVQRYGFHHQATYIVLTFDAPLDPTSAELLSNYSLVGPVIKYWRGGNPIALGSATYDPATYTVTLSVVGHWNVHWKFRLTVNGSTPQGVASPTGDLLDGAGDGQPGTNFVTYITRKNLAGRASQLPADSRVASHAAHRALAEKSSRPQ